MITTPPHSEIICQVSLFEKGMISDHRSKAKSVVLTELSFPVLLLYCRLVDISFYGHAQVTFLTLRIR
jgi:hypothetical protein